MAFDKDAFISALDSMSVMELNDLVKAIETKFGVSAAAMAAPGGGGGGAAAAVAEEQTEFTLVLSEIGANKVQVIKAGTYANKALDANGVKALASIPTKEVLLSQLLGLMQSPIARIARVLAMVAEKRGGGADASAAPAAAEAAPAAA